MQDKNPHTPSLSISVVCYHSTDAELRALLASIITAVEYLKTSYDSSSILVYLIDNSEQQELTLVLFTDLQKQLDAQNIELRLVHGHGNVGYGCGHNLVLSRLASKYHLMLNPDVRLEKQSLASGFSFLENSEDVILVSPFARYANGDKQYLCKRYPSVLTFIVRGFFPSPLKILFAKRLAGFEMHDLSEQQATTNITIVSGCCMLCRTEAFRKVNGFDENYFLYFEDFDLSLRMRKLGKLAYVPTMRIEHAGGHAARKGWTHLKMFARSGLRFFNTHGWRIFHQTS